jgi:UDP-N-acetylmuramate dehydrogenase
VLKPEYEGLKEVISESKLKYDEPMKKHITMKVGGNCDVLVLPTSVDEIKKVINYAKEKNIKWYVLGNGSNVIVKDEGIRGIVIKLFNNFSGIEEDGEYITALSGTGIPRLSQYAKGKVLTGLEFACGIPGTVGGCVMMNAGAYGSEMSNVVDSVEYLDEDGNIKTFRKDELKFSYRHSIFAENKKLVILSVKFKLDAGNTQEIENKMKENNQARKDKQPLEYPSAGSVFRRPTGYFVGKLVSDAGLRGVMVGGAQVSEKHTGFIVNKSNATCKDVLDLIELVKKTVNEKFGILLETEVEILGGNN